MEEVIRLKTGLDSLSEKEFLTIIADRDYITNIIFRCFHLELINTKSLSDINDHIVPKIQAFNDKITKIITSRPTKCNKSLKNDDEERKPLQLHQLPSVMISSISSFLEFEDVLNFEKCNKSIFIGTRSPISLHELSMDLSSWDSMTSKLIKYIKESGNIFHWNRFKSIKAFTFDMEFCFKMDDSYTVKQYFYELTNIPCSVWQNLEALTLNLPYYVKSEFPESFYYHLQSLNLYNLKTLKLINTTGCPMNGIYDILSYNFRGIAAEYWLTGFSNDIESLHLTDYDLFLFVNTKLNNLKEICTTNTSQKDLDFVNQQNLNYLERINLNHPKIDELEKKSLKLLLSTPSIHYISIHDGYDIAETMSILNKALKGISKKCMKIRVECDDDKIMRWKLDKIKKEICKLVEILKNQTNDFMIIGIFKCDEIDFDLIKYDVSIQSKVENFRKKKIWKFIINNKKCKINGYQQRWLLRCDKCKQSHF